MFVLIQNLKTRQTKKIPCYYRHLHYDPYKGQKILEIECDTDDGKVCLYLDEREQYLFRLEFALEDK